MTDLRKAAEQAARELKQLIYWHGIRYSNDKLIPAHKQTPEIQSAMKTLKELRQALEEPANSTKDFVEPILYMDSKQIPKGIPDWKPGMVFPKPKREWVGIEPQEIGQIWAKHKEVYGFGIELEQVLKERNT